MWSSTRISWRRVSLLTCTPPSSSPTQRSWPTLWTVSSLSSVLPRRCASPRRLRSSSRRVGRGPSVSC
ncbi:hypothetical protein BN1708_018002 [Verticillium longisporum]|uniref:Uncharacterized protein n=1 Tax=Verticillium longisporum TaxID=100787 RepID=A0A0G4LM28_VERLO|nr:hypothetical protein BN1708_018002 [Verticillium longisporum]